MSIMGVYKLHKLARKDNKSFDVDSKLRVERDLHVVENAYAEHINAHSKFNGLVYEKDEKATEIYLSGKPFKNVKEFTEFEEVSDENEKPKRGRKKTETEELSDETEKSED